MEKNAHNPAESASKDLEVLKNHFGLDLSYPLEMGRRFYPSKEQKIVLVVNTFLDDSRALIDSSIRSVLWIKDWDVTFGIQESKDMLKRLAAWVKETHREIPPVLLYVVEEDIFDDLERRVYSQMHNIREIFLEKAVENGYKYLRGVQDIFSNEGLDCDIHVVVGNLCTEIGHTAGENGIVVVGNNVLVDEVKKFVSNTIVVAPGDIVLASPKIEGDEAPGNQDLNMIEKLKRFVSPDKKLREVIHGGETEK